RGQLLARFRSRAAQAFLQSYRAACAPALQLPADREHALLQATLIEKAAYEVCYEARYRPDWVAIPLCSLAELARAELMARAIDNEDHRSWSGRRRPPAPARLTTRRKPCWQAISRMRSASWDRTTSMAGRCCGPCCPAR